MAAPIASRGITVNVVARGPNRAAMLDRPRARRHSAGWSPADGPPHLPRGSVAIQE